MRKIGAIGIGEDGKYHPTAAGLLMFGYEYEITREFPNYFLDYQENRSLGATDGLTASSSDQKSRHTTQKTPPATQKSDQKVEVEPQSGQKSIQKIPVSDQEIISSSQKVLEKLAASPQITISRLASDLSMSASGIKKILKLLKESGRIQRVGPDKGGHWEVLGKD